MARRMITEGVSVDELDADELPDLTPQQLEFVRGILAGKTASDAYRAADDCSNSTANTVWAAASRLRADTKVGAWIAAGRKAHLGTAVLTKEAHLNELERLKELAIEKGNLGAAVQAEQLRGKVAGHHVDKIEDVTDRTDVVATLKQIEAISPDLAADLAAQHGIEWSKPQGETAH